MLDISEHALRAQALAAQQELEAVRMAIAANEVTCDEGEYALQLAFRRYCKALRRFSDAAVYGTVTH